MKTNAIKNDLESFVREHHVGYIALIVLAAAVAQSLIVMTLFLFNGIDI